jgi:protein-disulfide isomerase
VAKSKAKRRKAPTGGRKPAPPVRSGGAGSRAPSAKAWIGLALGLAVALAAVLIVASRLGADEEAALTPAGEIEGAAEVERLFAGIPQDGVALGSPDAPVTLVEFADLQCPFCAQFAAEGLPGLIEEYVRDGEVRILFRPVAFIGEDSEKAARAVIAAGFQGKLWNAAELLYRNQGRENSGWVSDELLAALGPSVEGLDGEQLLADAETDAVTEELQQAADEAQAADIPGTPAFQLGPTGGDLELFQPTSYSVDGFRDAIDELLRQQ